MPAQAFFRKYNGQAAQLAADKQVENLPRSNRAMLSCGETFGMSIHAMALSYPAIIPGLRSPSDQVNEVADREGRSGWEEFPSKNS